MKWRFTGRGAAEAPEGESISQRAKFRRSPKAMAWFFSIFLLAGLGFSLFFVLSALKVLQARLWTPVDCEIVSSAVASHSGSDGSTYSIEVSYRYSVDGVEYTGERYEFLGGSSSGYDSKRRTVDALPEGSIATCYVDPNDPFEAVLERGLSWVYLFALLPLIFVAVGGGGVFWSLTAGKRASARAGGQLSGAAAESVERDGAFREIDSWSSPVATGPIELEEQLSPWGKLGWLLFGCVFWNGIVSIFVWQIWSQWRSTGDIEGCVAIFMIPFVLVGLALLAAIPYQMLALANPRPRLTLSRAAIPLGGSAQLTWSFIGSAARLDDLRISIEGSESATYRRGTTTHTDTEVFASLDLVERGAGMSLASGSVTVRIPIDTMHTFEASRNKIQWQITLHGSIARWPDVNTEFPLVVLPRGGDR